MREKSYLELTEYNMKTYGKNTEDYLNNVPNKTDTNSILKQIAQNLAYIADELSTTNDRLADVVSYMDSSNGSSFEEDDDYSEEEEFIAKMNKPCKCFICGNPVDFDETGGEIWDSYGNITFACKDCGPKFDAIIGDIIGRKVRC